jgi:hypothetical protein
MTPIPTLLRVRPLALAMALALPFGSATGFADAAIATRAMPAAAPTSTQAPSHKNAPLPRPDGSILWIVDNCNDAGAGSLRDVAAHANHGDGIDLGSLSCSTISVTSGAITLHDVELVGPGAGQLEIDGTGNQNRRIFNHAGGGGRLDISGVTINGGIYASNAGLGGGCLRSDGGSSLRITDSVFRNCLVLTPLGQEGNARGGAIASYGGGAVGLYGTTLANNIARTDHEFADGGALYTQGSVVMRRSTISNNSVSAIHPSPVSGGTQGGGLFSRGSVTIEDSTLDGNSATRDAGAALVLGGGTLLRSTVSNNYAGAGTPGVVMVGNYNAAAGIYNSTISGNVSGESSQYLSGGLYLGTDTTTIINCTVTGNSETNQVSTKFGAGIVFGENAINISMSGTIASGNYFDDGEPPYASDDMDGPASATFVGDSNLIGWSHLLAVPADTIWQSDPRLGPLQNNGGPTRTHMPLPDSVAVDAGAAHGYDTDQRGYARVVGAAADIGSVESGNDTIFVNGFESVTD